jgi:hypothetical protein
MTAPDGLLENETTPVTTWRSLVFHDGCRLKKERKIVAFLTWPRRSVMHLLVVVFFHWGREGVGHLP